MGNELDRQLREWADNAMRPAVPVDPVHWEDCTIYECKRDCPVLWHETMKRVGASLLAVVDMVNEGNARAEDVVREGRDD